MKNLKIHQMLLIAIGLFVLQAKSFAQYKDYKLNAKADTINATDRNGLKQGKWVVHVDELRGEPGYEEEGIFKDSKKEGYWRKYTLQGDLLAVENYKKGGKHGLQQYYTFLGELIREENWRGYDPDAPYDTIAVYGTESNQVIEFRIVKAEQYSVRQGEWRYYDPGTGMIERTEQWERNNLVKPKRSNEAAVTSAEKKKIEKTPEMLEWERKNKGKKNAIRDGKTGL